MGISNPSLRTQSGFWPLSAIHVSLKDRCQQDHCRICQWNYETSGVQQHLHEINWAILRQVSMRSWDSQHKTESLQENVSCSPKMWAGYPKNSSKNSHKPDFDFPKPSRFVVYNQNPDIYIPKKCRLWLKAHTHAHCLHKFKVQSLPRPVCLQWRVAVPSKNEFGPLLRIHFFETNEVKGDLARIEGEHKNK